jgi:hypothetical protein
MTAAAVALSGFGLTGCGDDKARKQAEADANATAAGFTPPSVTSRLDFGSQMERRFRALDRNGDDVLTGDEMPRRNSRLMALDRNGDGKISAIEWSEGTLAWFDKMDLNHDGVVTTDEREQYDRNNPKK